MISRELAKVLFSNRFLRHRYIWTLLITFPFVVDIMLDDISGSPVRDRRRIDQFRKNFEERLVDDLALIKEDEWNVLQNLQVKKQI